MKTYKERVVSPIKKFGGKFYIAKKIAREMEKRSIFVNGFCGTCINSLVLDEKFDKHYCIDKDPHIINFWKVLKQFPERMMKFLLHTEYSEENFQAAKKYLSDNEDEIIESFFDAIMYMVSNRMSRSADMENFGWSDRFRRGKPEYISAYESAIDNILHSSNLIQNIEFICDDYMDFMTGEDLDMNNDVTIYADPPYLHETRSACRPYGKFEVDEAYHRKLLNFLLSIDGIGYISGYDSDLYANKLENCKRIDWLVANSSSQSKKKELKKEVLWEVRRS